MKIGIIGNDKKGLFLGKAWAEEGHEVLIGTATPNTLGSFLKEIDGEVQAVSIEETFEAKCQLYVLAIPFHEVDRIAELYAGEYGNTIILDLTNPDPNQDGAMAKELLTSNQNASEYVAMKFSTAKTVKAFNTVQLQSLKQKVGDTFSPLAIPYAAQDHESKEIVRELIESLGYEAVYIGDLAQTEIMDPEQKIYGKSLNRSELEVLINS